jgi:hypothetical protein
MSTLIVNSDNKEDLKLFMELANRLGLTTKILSKEDKEDIALYKAMLEGRKTKFVSREAVMKKLSS